MIHIHKAALEAIPLCTFSALLVHTRRFDSKRLYIVCQKCYYIWHSDDHLTINVDILGQLADEMYESVDNFQLHIIHFDKWFCMNFVRSWLAYDFCFLCVDGTPTVGTCFGESVHTILLLGLWASVKNAVISKQESCADVRSNLMMSDFRNELDYTEEKLFNSLTLLFRLSPPDSSGKTRQDI